MISLDNSMIKKIKILINLPTNLVNFFSKKIIFLKSKKGNLDLFLFTKQFFKKMSKFYF